MSEAKRFPEQPVLSQILDVILSSIINAANRKHHAIPIMPLTMGLLLLKKLPNNC